MSKLTDMIDSIKELQNAIEVLEKEYAEKLEPMKKELKSKLFIAELFEDHQREQQEAFVTLITQRDQAGRIDDEDFRQFAKTAGIDSCGLLENETQAEEKAAPEIAA